MTIFNLYIFDEKGSLIYYKEWLRKKHTSMEKDEEGKLLYGMLFSIKSFAGKLSPTDMKDGFTSYKTSRYRLNYYETPSMYKFVMNTDTSVTHPIVRDLLQNVYAKVFVDYAVKNPMYTLGQPITCELFDTRLDEFVKASSFFK